jgi:hypothetical protein
VTARRWLGAALLLAAAPAQAQRVSIGGQATWAAVAELSADRKWDGPGFGASARMRLGRFDLEVAGMRAALDPSSGSDPALSSFDLTAVDARASLRVYRFIEVEGGVGRHFADPELAVQDIGFVRLGVRLDSRIAPRSRVWARAAYLPVVEFSGGGDPGLALETGFGLEVGLGDRWALQTDYLFQRFDRASGGDEWPTQLWQARLGVEMHVLR